MTPYYFYFFFIFILYLTHLFLTYKKISDELVYYTLLIFIILFTGLRFEVGSDWQNYEYLYSNKIDKFVKTIFSRDIGYSLISYIFKSLNFDYVIFNVFLSIIGIIPVFIYCRNNPNWFIGVFMAVPYFFTICVMGYVRQGVATGILFLVALSIQKNNKFLFLSSVILATSIHKSAIVFLLFYIVFFYTDNFKTLLFSLANYIKIIILGVFFITFLFVFVVLQDQWQHILHYINVDKTSSGALLRALMNMIPTIAFLIFNKRMKIYGRIKFLCYIFSILSILFLIIIYFKILSSTFIDRFNIFLIIFHIIIFPRIHLIFKDRFYGYIIDLNIIIYNFIIMYFWINYSVNGRLMLYKMVPLKNLL